MEDNNLRRKKRRTSGEKARQQRSSVIDITFCQKLKAKKFL